MVMKNFIMTKPKKVLKQLASKVDAMDTHSKMLETQILQLAQQKLSSSSPSETFIGKLGPNPKGQINIVML